MKMNHLYLRSIEESNEDALEYASNFISVDLYFQTKVRNATDFSIRIYSSCGQLMGVGSLFPSNKKPTDQLHFDVSSVNEWKQDEYVTYVFRNDKPCWFARGKISTAYYLSYKLEMVELTANSLESFFINKAANQCWWEAYESFRFDRGFTNSFIEKLRLISEGLDAKSSFRYPYYFVVGSTLPAGRFAGKVLAPILAPGETKKVINIHVATFLFWVAKENRLVQEMNASDVVLLNFSTLSEVHHGCYFFDRLLYLIETHRIKSTVIFYGAANDMKEFQRFSASVSYHYNLANTFVLPVVSSASTAGSYTNSWIYGEKSINGRNFIAPNEPDDYTPDDIKRSAELLKERMKQKYQERMEQDSSCQWDPNLFFDLLKEINQEPVEEDEIRGARIDESDPFRKEYFKV